MKSTQSQVLLRVARAVAQVNLPATVRILRVVHRRTAQVVAMLGAVMAEMIPLIVILVVVPIRVLATVTKEALAVAVAAIGSQITAVAMAVDHVQTPFRASPVTVVMLFQINQNSVRTRAGRFYLSKLS